MSTLALLSEVSAQGNFYRDIKAYYKGIRHQDDRLNKPVTFIDESILDLDPNQELLQIMLIRHGEPRIKRKGWFSFYDAHNYLQAYDTVKVYPIQALPVKFEGGHIKRVYCSPLPRARSTASQLFDKKTEIIYDSVFVEFTNEIIPVPWIRLPLQFWTVSSRLLWMAGLHSDQVPGFPAEKVRAREAGFLLARIAVKDKRTVLVAHGFLNRYIIKYLKRKGWKHSYDGGYGYTNVQVMSKIKER